VSDRRKYLILMGAILAALAGAILLAVPGSPIQRKPTLGLDLRGGLEVVLKAVPPKGHVLTADDMNRSVSIMESRINKLGVSEPEIRKQGANEIVIQLAGVHDATTAAKLIGKTAQLMLFDFEFDLTGPSTSLNGNPVATPSLYTLLTSVQKQASKGEPESYYLFHSKTVKVKTTKKTTVKGKNGKKTTILKPTTKTEVKHSLVEGPEDTLSELLKPYGNKVPAKGQVLKVPDHTLVVNCPTANGCLGASAASPTGTYYYLMKYYPTRKTGYGPIPEMTGGDLVLSGTRADVGTSGGPVVLLQFTNHGANVFQKITKAEAQRGQRYYDLAGKPGTPTNYAQHFAIVLDGELQSTPYIDFQQNPDGISGPNAEIDMGQGGTFKDAQNLALVLQTGALPVSFTQIERTDVSATLGKSSLTQAWHAALIGLAVVALFLLVLYRFLGLVAVAGLAIYATFYYAAILLFNVTLTLPGFAGLILTIGVAADANVVVFERIKEEVRAGKSVKAAVARGYSKGFHTILDANAVTAITALVLFLVAVADVKGFALMLLLGTVISLITAVAATRAMLGLLSGFKWFDNPRFMGARGQQISRWQRIDINSAKRRRIFLSVATVAILLSVVAIAVKGLNLGIDFRGGTQMSFRTATAQTTGTVQSVLTSDGFPDAVVQGRGAQTGQRYSQFQVRTKHLTNAQQSTLVEDLHNKATLKGQPDVQTVSSSFSSQIAHDAILAVIISFLLISIYIALRFQWRFAIPILRTLFNDIVITLGVYALSGREVTISTVAAVLTVLGYSIYDTIIVFDRIRENMPLMPKAKFAAIANLSVSETLRRSVATSLITLLPITSLLIFGGQTLKDFAFALMVGISLGAVSTIFVATPFLTFLMERSPEFRRRVGGETIEDGIGVRALKRLTGAAPRDGATVVKQPQPDAPAAAEPAGEFADGMRPAPSAQARRDKRGQRRRTRPHGRAR
jgi:SecD/SecF fusion protein